MIQPLKRIEVAFFRTPRGNEPVREWLKALDDADRMIIGQDLQNVEFGWPVGMPLCRPMGQGLHEVRSNLRGRIARILFMIKGEQMVLLHAFIKKTQKTSQDDLNLGLERKRLVDSA